MSAEGAINFFVAYVCTRISQFEDNIPYMDTFHSAVGAPLGGRGYKHVLVLLIA